MRNAILGLVIILGIGLPLADMQAIQLLGETTQSPSTSIENRQVLDYMHALQKMDKRDYSQGM